MMFVTNSIQLKQQVPYQGSSWRVWRLQNSRTSLKYAAALVLLAEKETVVLGKIDRLTEVGRWYGNGMEINVE